MQKWDMKSFEISDYDMFSDEKDVIVATYKVKVEGTYDGKDMSGIYNAGTVWKQENGKWLAIFHTNVRAETPAGIAAVSDPAMVALAECAGAAAELPSHAEAISRALTQTPTISVR